MLSKKKKKKKKHTKKIIWKNAFEKENNLR